MLLAYEFNNIDSVNTGKNQILNIRASLPSLSMSRSQAVDLENGRFPYAHAENEPIP